MMSINAVKWEPEHDKGVVLEGDSWVDYRPWCDKHGLMAQGNGYWYCETCERLQAVDVSEMYWLKAVDEGVRDLVEALNKAGLQTDWCCSGEPGHMLIRPTIQIRNNGRLNVEREGIELVMEEMGYVDYWLLLNFAHGARNTHGGEPTWLLMLPGRFDLTTALPVAYSADYQGDDSLDPEWAKAHQQAVSA
jgi:hypothetical protein